MPRLPPKRASPLGSPPLYSEIRTAYTETLPATSWPLMTRSWTKRARMMVTETKLRFWYMIALPSQCRAPPLDARSNCTFIPHFA
jgi:hypothetical protein